MKRTFILPASTIIFFIALFSPSGLYASSLPVSIIEIGAYKSSGYEYIKVHNNTSQDISLENWKFKEGFSDSKPQGIKHSLKEYNQGFILLAGQTALITQDPEKFLSQENFEGLILDSSWGSLKEQGEKIELIDSNSNTIESFTYLPCPDGPLVRQDYTLADYSSRNWQCSENSKDNEENENKNSSSSDSSSFSFPPSSSPSYSEPPTPDLNQNIIINELYPNPDGPDNEKEFIELKNIGDTTICLNNWTIEDKEKRRYTIFSKHFQETFIRPQQYLVVWRSKSRLALNNFQSETIKLYDNQNKLIDKVSYSPPAPQNQALARTDQGEWFWTLSPTPGKNNIVSPPNHPPVGVIEPLPSSLSINQKISFDASDSYDPDGDDLFFIWDFGDGGSSTLVNPVYSYQKPGDYLLRLYVFDSQDASSTLTLKIKIKGAQKEPAPPSSQPKQTSFSFSPASVLISEIYPFPSSYEEEFIELYNSSSTTIDIGNCYLQDKSGRRFAFPSPTYLPPYSYHAFYKSQTHLSLNNTKPETITLFSPQKIPLFQVSYQKAHSQMSYCFDFQQKRWFWSKEPTPSGENIFLINQQKSSPAKPSFLNLETKTKNQPVSPKTETPLFISIGQINPSLIGKLTKIKGEITEKKSRYLWLDDGTGEIKVSLASSFPPRWKSSLAEGNYLQVIGTLKQNKNKELYLAPSSLQDIKIIQKASSTKDIKGEQVSSSQSSLSSSLFPSFYYYLPLLLLIGFWAWQNFLKKD